MSVPSLPRGVRLHDDRVRGCMVLLGPERALMLDETGTAILSAVDGARSIDQIAADLARRYSAPIEAVRPDVTKFLGDLAQRRLVDLV